MLYWKYNITAISQMSESLSYLYKEVRKYEKRKDVFKNLLVSTLVQYGII